MSKKTNKPAAAPTDASASRSPGYSTLELEQNGHAFFLTTIPIDDLFDYCVVERRNENQTEGFQHRLSESRA